MPQHFNFRYNDRMMDRIEEFPIAARTLEEAIRLARSHVYNYLDGESYPGRFEFLSVEVIRINVRVS